MGQESPIPLSLSSDACSPKNYALYKGTLWSSRKKLQLANWRFLIESVLRAEEVKLGHASNSDRPLCSRENNSGDRTLGCLAARPRQVLALWKP
jgi:hypothetical protein